MATAKTTMLTFRIEPDLKAVLRKAADRKHHSIANLVEVLIRDYCTHNGIAIPAQHATSSGAENQNRKGEGS